MRLKLICFSVVSKVLKLICFSVLSKVLKLICFSVFFIPGVAWAQGPQAATPRMKKTAAAAPAAAPAAAASVSEYFFLTLNKIVFYFSYVFCNF